MSSFSFKFLLTRCARWAPRALLLWILVLSAGCSDSGPGGDKPSGAKTVLIIPHQVTLKRNDRRIDAVGTARARLAATIFPESGGEVTAVSFVSGQRVEAGQPLATLDDTEQRLAVARARVALQDAEQLLARYTRIDVPGAISDSQVDAAKTAVEAARIDLEVAREAEDERTIRAPFAGHVGLTEIDPGARIDTQTELTRLDDRSVLYVDFAVPEQAFGLIKEGATLPMQPFASAQQSVAARVSVLSSRIDPVLRSFTVRAEIDNADDVLRPGMSFRVSFTLPGDAYPAIPEAAIVWGGDGAYLWVVRNGLAERLPVTIVSRRDGEVLVSADLAVGELVIAEGVQKVRSGTPVAATAALPPLPPLGPAPVTEIGR